MAKIQWPEGSRGAVSLSYDDGVPCQFQKVGPQLEGAGLRGTFYVTGYRSLFENADAWREMAARGHELGNHSLFHPCYSCEVFTWLDPAYDLRSYSSKRWVDEMSAANLALQMIDGQAERTFGNTCYDNRLGPEDHPVLLETLMPSLFIAARGQRRDHQTVNLDKINFYDLGTTDADYLTFDELKPRIEQVVSDGGWIIYTMHGVGKGTHNLYIDEKEHAQLIEWLGRNSSRIWTAPVRDVVKFLKK